MKVALLAVDAANNIPSWRGVLRNLVRTLRARGVDVEVVDYPPTLTTRLFAIKEWFVRRVIGRKYQRHRETRVLHYYSRVTDAALSRNPPDFAVALKAVPMAYSQTAVPLVLYNDAPWGALRNFYPEFSGMHPHAVAMAEEMEQRAQRRAVHSVYSSQWGVDEAHRLYGTPREKISMIEMGSNVEISHGAEAIEAFLLQRRATPTVEFLWLGIDWQRKRGDFAVAVVRELRRRQIDARLTVAGVEPALAPDDRAFVTVHRFLTEAQIAEALPARDFLILPTLADCTPLVYNEAASFGVPVLSTDVGGIATSIREGRNGMLFALSATPQAWADAIEPVVRDRDRYEALARASFVEYGERLNWDVAADKLMALFKRLLAQDPPRPAVPSSSPTS